MLYPNANKGINKLFIGQLLALIIAVVMIAAMVLAEVTVDDGPDSFEDLFEIFVLPFIVCNILFIIAAVFSVIGLGEAGRDERAFIPALILLVLCVPLILADVFYFRTYKPMLSDLSFMLCMVLQLASTLFIIKGVSRLADGLGRPDMVVWGRKVAVLMIIVRIAAIACELLIVFADPNGTVKDAVSIIEIAAAILTAVFAALCVVYLGKARKMLEVYN